MALLAGRLVKSISYLISSEFLSKFTSFLIIIILARSLSVSDFGDYSFITSFMVFFSVFLDFGLNIYFIKQVANEKKSASFYFSNIFFLKLMISSLVFILFLFLLFFVKRFEEIKLLLLLALIYTLLTSFSQFVTSVFKAHERMHFVLFVTLSEKLFLLSLFFYAMYGQLKLPQTFLFYIFSALLALLLSLFLVFYNFKITLHKIIPSFLKTAINYSYPLALSNFLWIIYFKIGTIMLYFFKTNE